MTFRRILALIFCTLLYLRPAFSQSDERGVIHFPASGGTGKNVMKLNGDWQFFYGKHLSAAEMEALSPGEKTFIAPPLNWMNVRVNGKKIPAFGIATFYVSIVLDSNRLHKPIDYAFRTIDISTAYQLLVNDSPVMATGSATTTSVGFKPGYYPHIGFYHTRKDTLKVVIHVSNFLNPYYSGISRPILFGTEEQLSRSHLLSTAMNILLMCIFGVLFFFEMLIFFFLPKEKTHLLVGLLAMILLIKMFLDGEMPIYHFLPDFSYYVGFRFWMITLFSIPVMFSLINEYFPKEIPRRIIRIVHVAYGIYGLLVMVLPLHISLNYVMPAIYFSIFCLAYLMVVVSLATIRGRKYALPHFFSFLIVFSCLLYDLVMITNPDKINFMSQIGFAVFLIFQTTIILFRFIKSHELSVKLTGDLESANQCLEETVRLRTKELVQTNLKLEKINQQKNFMLATTTHDLKNSFNILVNCSDFLVEDKSITEEQRIYAQMIQEATLNGYRVLENILSWARMEMTDYEGTNVIRDLKSLVEKEIEAFSKQIEQKSIRIRLDLDNSLHFACDEDQLYSIGRNLLSNAIKFSQPGGKITISNRQIENWVEIGIHDNGIGMNPDMIASLFDNTIDNKRTGTSGESGSGLGLIIVKELVESNKGTITCLSEPSKGTDFLIRFPRVSD